MPSETLETETHTLVTIACLSDNYAFLLRDTASGKVALVDVPEADPILAELATRGWTLDQIWLTHHHPDHVQGLAEVLAAHPARVTGPYHEQDRMPPLDIAANDGDRVTLGNLSAEILNVPGHTNGHIAFHVDAARVCFTADSLMALGCGRLFEGTAIEMHNSLLQLTRRLHPETIICSGHEYTASNAKFALTVDPDNTALQQRAADIERARKVGRFTVPSRLDLELATNPFLRANDPAIRAGLDMRDATDTAVFKKIRELKDAF